MKLQMAALCKGDAGPTRAIAEQWAHPLFDRDPDQRLWFPDLTQTGDIWIHHFSYLFDKLTSFADAGSELVVFVDTFNVDVGDFRRFSGWSALIAMLIVGVPDARWIFLNVENSPTHEGIAQHLRDYFGLAAIDQDRGTPLFDALGLRETISKLPVLQNSYAARPSGTSRDWQGGPMRPLALIFEDEMQFRAKLSLAAYAWGFRTCVVSNWLQAENFVGPTGICTHNEDSFLALRLALEDLSVDFPGRQPEGIHDPDHRRRLLPGLARPEVVRRFVSISDLASVEGETQDALKPTGDSYSLWKELRLDQEPRLEAVAYSGTEAPQARDPLLARLRDMFKRDAAADTRGDQPENSHGAQAKCIAIAEAVILRASQALRDGSNIKSLACAAVATNDIARLLEEQSPMLAAEALKLRHSAEVSVISSEIGSRSRLDIGPRLDELERELNRLKAGFPKSGQRNFVLNAKAQTVSELETILSRRAMVHDASLCRIEARKLRGRLTRSAIRSSKEFFFVRWLRIGVDKYVELASRSPWEFVKATLGAFVVCILAIFIAREICTFAGLWDASKLAQESFFYVDGPKETDGSLLKLVRHIVSLMGLLHFGILINMLHAQLAGPR